MKKYKSESHELELWVFSCGAYLRAMFITIEFFRKVWDLIEDDTF